MLKFICKFTSELSDQEWCDFIVTHYERSILTDEMIKRSECIFKKNIYGDSIHVIVYADDKPVATNAHLRNDLVPEIVCYQSLYSYVSPKVRKMGVFSKMSQMCVEKVDNAYIYGYPNVNSYTGLIKLGWKVIKFNVSSIYVGLARSIAKEQAMFQAICDDYVVWRFKPFNRSYRVCRVKGVNLLIKDKNYKMGQFYLVIGCVSDEVALAFRSVNPLILFSYIGGKGLLLLRKSENALMENTVYRTLDINIPNWRTDDI